MLCGVSCVCCGVYVCCGVGVVCVVWRVCDLECFF